LAFLSPDMSRGITRWRKYRPLWPTISSEGITWNYVGDRYGPQLSTQHIWMIHRTSGPILFPLQLFFNKCRSMKRPVLRTILLYYTRLHKFIGACYYVSSTLVELPQVGCKRLWRPPEVRPSPPPCGWFYRVHGQHSAKCCVEHRDQRVAPALQVNVAFITDFTNGGTAICQLLANSPERKTKIYNLRHELGSALSTAERAFVHLTWLHFNGVYL